MTKDLNDRLDDIFGAPTDRVLTDRPAAVEFRAAVAKDAGFFQKCGRCNGTGQTRWGVCFRCRGSKGKTFKTSPEARAVNRQQVADRKSRRLQEGLEAWVAAFPAEHAWLVKTAPRWDLAASLLAQVQAKGDLSEKQMAIITNGMARDAQRAAERAAAAASAPAVDVSHIVTAFNTARQKASRPGQRGVWVKPLRMRSGTKEAGTDLSFSVGKPGGNWEGVVFAETIEGKKLGMIKDGKFARKFACNDAEAAAVLDCASDPEKATAVFGKAWSICSICGHTLLNDGSIERGMGPICATKFGW